MARIAGVDLPRRKHIVFALPYLYGIGKTTARQICDRAKIPFDKKVEDLSEIEVKAIREIIDAEFRALDQYHYEFLVTELDLENMGDLMGNLQQMAGGAPGAEVMLPTLAGPRASTIAARS